ncbi:hypothetical protein FA13DRAFT_506293 [Coprinellus micaceus]|uniref:Uncharacterized protein n=1 Tax=Coprinellus micaceus TaxID=71717 RepID=A0A4Y7SBW2_COPMI|nr:hypothetical protein FA13DRAFT_506293 [Coprinellus micaceus]
MLHNYDYFVKSTRNCKAGAGQRYRPSAALEGPPSQLLLRDGHPGWQPWTVALGSVGGPCVHGVQPVHRRSWGQCSELDHAGLDSYHHHHHHHHHRRRQSALSSSLPPAYITLDRNVLVGIIRRQGDITRHPTTSRILGQ